MRSPTLWQTIGSLLVISNYVMGTPIKAVLPRTVATPPSQDPFYQPPADYVNATLGAILRSRPVPNPLAALGIAPLDIEGAYQLLFRTSDTAGNAEAAVTTVIVPHNADPTKLLSYQTAEDAADVDCAPSYAFQFETNPDTLSTQIELLLITAALNRGWYVNTPDYEGPKAAFTAGYQAGHATLDSIRAALSSTNVTSLSSNATVALWGYSGGSLASGWAAQLQPSYAPELEIAGVVLGGTVPKLESVIETINEGPFAGLGPAGIVGIAKDYPELQTYISEHLVATKAADFEKAASQCLLADIFQFAYQDIYSYFDTDIIDSTIAKEVYGANNLGNIPPDAPLYIYKAIPDEISPVNDTDVLVAGYCSQGVRVQYVRDLLAEHVTLMALGAPDAILWLEDRFNGVPVQAGCSTANITSTLADPAADVVLGELIVDDLLDILGQPIGPASIA